MICKYYIMETYAYIPSYSNDEEANYDNEEEEVSSRFSACISFFIFNFIVAGVVFILMKNY
jgi:putative copper export protein